MDDLQLSGPPTDPAPAPGPASAPSHADGFDLGPVIGQGGTGIVYLATRRSDGRRVAVKLLRHRYRDDDVLILRHVLEGRYLERVRHPHVVAVHATNPGPHEPAIVMDYVEGRSLRTRLARGPLPHADACRVLAQVASGLAAVHEQGLVHRDIKPDNVLVTERDGRIHALIADFGIACHRDGPRLTRTDAVTGRPVVLGTDQYLAPELRAGDVPTGAADCFSLGVMACELLTGERPSRVAGDRPARPPGLPDGLWEVIAACLAVRPQDRPDAASLAACFTELGETPGARPLASRWFRDDRPADTTDHDVLGGGGSGARDPLGAAADALAEHLLRQWRRDAAARGLDGVEPIPLRWRWSDRPVTSPIETVVEVPEGGPPFAPLPGTVPPTSATIREGGRADLFNVYGGLGSGRVVVLGAPGSGKSAAAILTVLDALAHRRRLDAAPRAAVPVPVLLTAYGWDPRARTLEEWFAERLAAAYPFLRSARYGRDAAAALVRGGRVALFLDGFDEMAEPLRAVALRAVDRQPRTFRLVLLAGTEEFARAAEHGHLRGAAALEVEPVTAEEASRYLTRTAVDPLPGPWARLIERLRSDPGGLPARALDSPLNLTLLRDGFADPADVERLLDAGSSASRGEVEEMLLDRLLPVRYRREPGAPPPPWPLERARPALAWLAARMNEHGVRDLVWWHVHGWFSPVPRVLADGACVALLMAATGAVVFGPPGGYAVAGNTGAGFGAVFGAAVGLVVGLLAGIVAEFRGFRPSLRGCRPSRPARFNVSVGLLAGAAVAVAVGGHTHPVPGVVAGLLAGGLAGRSAVRVRVLTRRFTWAAVPFEAPVGVVTGCLAGVAYGLAGGVAAGVGAGLVGGLAFGLMCGIARPVSDLDVPADPAASWRRDRWRGICLAVAYAFPIALELGVSHGVARGPLAGVVAGAGFGAPIAVAGMAAACDCWRAWLGFGQMRLRGGLPVFAMRFLKDAHERGVLRTAGPVYQFRHARLQDRLAAEHHSRIAGAAK